MSKKEQAKVIAEMMRKQTDKYGFPTKPRKSKDSDKKK